MVTVYLFILFPLLVFPCLLVPFSSKQQERTTQRKLTARSLVIHCTYIIQFREYICHILLLPGSMYWILITNFSCLVSCANLIRKQRKKKENGTQTRTKQVKFDKLFAQKEKHLLKYCPKQVSFVLFPILSNKCLYFCTARRFYFNFEIGQKNI